MLLRTILISLAVLTIPQPTPLCAQWRWTMEGDSIWKEIHFRPTIGLSYGFTATRLKNLSQTFADPRMLELKLGSLSQDSLSRDESIVSYDFHYLSIADISNDLGNKGSGGELNADLWRVGPMWEKGYGYALGPSSLIGFNGNGLAWSRLDIKDGIISAADSGLLMPFDETIRFGTKTEGGIVFRIVPLVAVTAGYERSMVFPAHQFWKWLGSGALEVIGQGLIDKFVERILESSPAAAPIVSFALKNGFSYAFYELRKDKMNYPFDSSPPLMNDSYKVGVTFVF